MAVLTERAPAKINLTLHVRGRRVDGYHELESFVVFAGVGDTLRLEPGAGLALRSEGPTANRAGAAEDNLVMRAARALAGRVAGLTLGSFHLIKRLPVAAGLGGGSSDAAAALRLLARANDLAADHPAIVEAARATGADVPVCLEGRARVMAGIGERLGPPVALPPLFAVLVNPGVPVATADVFRALDAGAVDPSVDSHLNALARFAEQLDRRGLIDLIAQARNDLEAPAIAFAPLIAEALAMLAATPGNRLNRMSGSGATVFGLYDDRRAASRAGRVIAASRPGWWVRATVLR